MHSFRFPTILAGPIIRRVEQTQVYIWMALSGNYLIHANTYKIELSGDTEADYQYQHIPTQSKAKMVQLGKNLFIYLIKINPIHSAFPTDTLIGYNLHFNRGSEQFDLSTFGLLTSENPQSIVYGHLKYPTFQIKSEKNHANLLYGSCRKLHGEGIDTLTLADSTLENEHFHLIKRPDTLFLMGDQIYADDIADPLFQVIRKIGESLIGHSENLHMLDERLNKEPFQTCIHQINGRQFITENFCQFTSTHAQNHLLTLGEYSAMYLLSWSPQLWELAHEYDLFHSFEEAANNNEIYFAFKDEELYLEKNKIKNRYLKQQEALIDTQQSLYQVRRLFANIPTYMIFDDHDITDDWNLSYDWKKNVSNSPLGRHVIANGLSAYWAFQGWGNQPDRFDHFFIKLMTIYFHSLIHGEITSFHEEWVNLLWNFKGWHFVSATSPKALFLDTRTQREYEFDPKPIKFIKMVKENPPPPILINKSGWNIASKLLYDSGWKSGNTLMIVSATPVYGLGLIESILHDYIYPLNVLGIEIQNKIDFEAWKYNGKGFTELLYKLSDWNPSQCIILSGDVHYASSVKAKVSFKNGKELKISQFTSSPIKNMSFSGIGGMLMKMTMTLNSRSRINKDIQRYCLPSFHIVHRDVPQESYIWSDQLRYQPLNKTAIMETENNLGFLIISSQSIQNELLKKSE